MEKRSTGFLSESGLINKTKRENDRNKAGSPSIRMAAPPSIVFRNLNDIQSVEYRVVTMKGLRFFTGGCFDMKLCTETVTIFNSTLNTNTGDIELHPAVISGVHVFEDLSAVVDPTTGLKAASKITVRIPLSTDTAGRQYADSKAYQDNGPDGLFTLQAGDLLIKGEETESLTFAELKQKHGQIFTVLGVTDSTRAPRAPHWKVVAA